MLAATEPSTEATARIEARMSTEPVSTEQLTLYRDVSQTDI
jgi:hypothetical protein